MAKEWAWSYSKLKNYRTCPKRHYEVDVQKNYVEDSEQLTWGNSVHDALAKAVGSGEPLPVSMKSYQKWVDAARALPGQTLVERKYALSRMFTAQPYFGPQVWFRGIADLLNIQGNKGIAWDWKTGKIKHDSEQLLLMAACVLVHHPELDEVETEFVWLQEDCTTKDTWTRAALRGELVRLIPEVDNMEIAYKALNFPPLPGKLCRKWCPVQSCTFHKKGA
jgi:hypothetical protein